jgi:hypothetical protein
MTSPRDRDRDLRLERLGDRDGRRHAHLGEAAHVGSPLAPGGSVRENLAAYIALIDAVFTAPGAAEWLLSLRRKFGAVVAGTGIAPRHQETDGAIRVSDPGLRRA